jgi:hypothetical protein
MRVKEYIKECWSEFWNPNIRYLQITDRLLSVILLVFAIILAFIPSGENRETAAGGMAEMYWVIPLAILIIFILVVIPYRVASKYYKQRNDAWAIVEEIESEKQELFEIDWPSRPINIFVGKGNDGSWTHREGGVGPASIKLTNKQDLLSLERLSLSPEVRFVRSNGYGSTNAIKVSPLLTLPTMKNTTVGIKWDNANPLLWELKGLPLKLSKGEILFLPQTMISVEDAEEAG